MTKYSLLSSFSKTCHVITFLTALITVSTARGATINWTGSVSSNWSVAGNWDLNRIPTASDDVVIGSDGIILTTDRLPIINSDVTINNFTFGDSWTGVKLTVNAVLTVTNTVLQRHNSKGHIGNFIQGTGTIISRDITIGDGTTPATASGPFTTSLNFGISSLIAVNIYLKPTRSIGDNGSKYTDSFFYLNSGVATLSGSIITSNMNQSYSYFTVRSGAKLILTGAEAIILSGASGSRNYFDFQSGSIVEYAYTGGASQKIYTDLSPNLYVLAGNSQKLSYSNINFTGYGLKISESGNLYVANNWTSANGKLDLQTNNPVVNFNGSIQSLSDLGSDAGNGVYFKRVIFSNSGTKTISSGKFSVASTGVLTMAGTSTLSTSGNSNLYLRSNASGSANVAAIPATCFITGNVNVETWFTGGAATNSTSTNANRGTRTLSSPVDDAITTIPVYKQLQDSMFITGSGDPGFDNNGMAATLLTYKESAKYSEGAAAQFTPVTTLATRSLKGHGFFLFYRGKRNPSAGKILPISGTNYAIPESFAANFLGKLNQQEIAVNLDFTSNVGPNDAAYNGFNLIGNPYPATIDWTKVTRSDNSKIDNMVSVIKPGGGMTTYSKGIVVNGGKSALPAGAVVPSVSSGTAPFYIQPGQGFYVRARAAGTNIKFTEASKAVYLSDNTTTTSPARLLSTQSDFGLGANRKLSELGPGVVLEDFQKPIYIELSDQFSKEETAVVFAPGNEPSFGLDDASYFASSTVALSTLTSDGKNVSINFMPEITEVNEIKLVVAGSASGAYKLKFNDLKGIGKFQVFLEDQLLRKIINVKKIPTYNFTIDKKDSQTFGGDRFKVLFFPPLPPAVELMQFTGLANDSFSELNWSTSREKDNDYFEIERSDDAENFTVIGRVKGGADSETISNYSFIDKSIQERNTFYRLKMVDKAGDWEYSKMIMLTVLNADLLVDAKSFYLDLFPNPAISDITINLPLPNKNGILISIFSVTGEMLRQIETKEEKIIKIDLSYLARGLYILKLTDAKTNEIVGKAKFIKN